MTESVHKAAIQGATAATSAEEPAGACAERSVPVKRSNGKSLYTDDDSVAVEEPLEIRLSWLADSNNTATAGSAAEAIEKNIAVTMRTPGNDAELALGFLFTEGIVGPETEFSGISQTDDNVITLSLANPPAANLEHLQRNFYMTSSCGVCGKASLDAIRVSEQFPNVRHDFLIAADVLVELPAQLQQQQALFAGTGSIHAAGLFNREGLCGPVFEDVGRHNAVDKLIGYQYRDGKLPLEKYGLLVSGRASFELVQKARLAGCSMLAAVGAPSSLAIDLAWDADMTLIGFLRDGRFNVYTGADRVA
jgi:FdhD protein